MNITQRLNELDAMRIRRDEIDTIRKDMNKQIDESISEIVDFALAQMDSEFTTNGKKFKIKRVSNYYEIDSKSDHSKKVELYERLKELGFDSFEYQETATINDDLQIEKQQTVNAHRTKFTAFIKSLPESVVVKLVSDGLLEVEIGPEITVDRVKIIGTKSWREK